MPFKASILATLRQKFINSIDVWVFEGRIDITVAIVSLWIPKIFCFIYFCVHSSYEYAESTLVSVYMYISAKVFGMCAAKRKAFAYVHYIYQW